MCITDAAKHCFTGMRSSHSAKLSQDHKSNVLYLMCTLLCIISTKHLKCKYNREIVPVHHVLSPKLLSDYEEQFGVGSLQ